MAVMKISVVKAGGQTVDVDTDAITNSRVYEYIFEIGLKTLLNRGTTKITKASVPVEAERFKQAMEAAEKQLKDMYEGKTRIVGSKAASGKASGEVMTEARRLARNMVKDAMKAKKIKVSYVEASEITKAANALLAADPSIIEKAKASLEARKEEGDKAADILSKIVGAVPQSDKLIAKAAAAKAADAKDKPLSAKQAGKPAKAKPQAAPAH